MAPTSRPIACAGVTQVKKKMFDFLKREDSSDVPRLAKNAGRQHAAN